ncbi:MAG: SLC13 family permease [Desulfobacter postgatei]|uniref:SLC13 family permease n=1 Tax=Desulfobacter postgatei TaxID=2293 RepID=UPI0023F2A5B2|nr:SLC13 family permease [Desulfobacter postgatei]MDD4275336.1 SLC13 family permease [Desulfobacter postgatei]
MSMINIPVVLVSLILIVTLVLLISEKISVDKTAIGIMVLLALTGILSPSETVAGFANPAVITVGSMFLLSHGLIRTGAVGFLTELVLKFSKGSRKSAFLIILVGGAVFVGIH